MLKINDLIAKSKNGTEIIVSLIPLNKIQNTRNGLKTIDKDQKVSFSVAQGQKGHTAVNIVAL